MTDDLASCRFMKYIKQGPCIGSGVHGRVYRARHKISGHMVALKKVCVSDVGSGMSMAGLREIAVLKELRSDCFVRLIDGMSSFEPIIEGIHL